MATPIVRIAGRRACADWGISSGAWPSLKLLNITGTRASDPGLAPLKGLTRLRYLGLRGTQCTGVGADELQAVLPDASVRP